MSIAISTACTDARGSGAALSELREDQRCDWRGDRCVKERTLSSINSHPAGMLRQDPVSSKSADPTRSR